MNRDWINIVQDGYTAGKSEPAIRRDLEITKRQWDHYMSAVPAFRNHVENCRELAQVAFEEKMRELSLGQVDLTPSQANALKFTLSAKYGWTEKTENRNVNLDLNQLKEELRLRAPEILKLIQEDEKLVLPSPDRLTDKEE